MRHRCRCAPLVALIGAPLLLASATTASAAGIALSGSSVNALASFAGRIWAGTDSGLYSLSPGSGWTAVGGPLGGREVNALAIAGSWLVAGTQDGAVRTTDGGTWVGAGLGGERVVSLSALGNTVLAGTGHDTPSDGAVQRSDNSGASWTSAPVAPALLGLSGETVQAVLPPNGSSPAWAGTAGSGPYRSSDGRGNWTTASGMQSGWVTSFWREPASGRLLAGTDDGLYTWNGSSWTAAPFPQQDPWVQALATGSDGQALAGTYDGAVFAQNAGGGWTQKGSGLQTVLSLLALPGGGVLVGTTDGVSCIACPAAVARAASSPGASGARATLPPPGARGASLRPGSPGATAGPTATNVPTPKVLHALAGGTAGNGSGSSGGGVGRWLIAGGLVALSVLLLAIGIVRTRRTRQPED